MLIDTHAHLTSSRFTNKVDRLLERAAQSGVQKVISIACDLGDSLEVTALARKYQNVYPTVGIHPCYVHEVDEPEWMKQLEHLAQDKTPVAIGEIGLDYYHSPPDGFSTDGWRTLQAEYFSGQLDLARKLDLPVVVHQRESGDDVLEILQDFPEVKAVLHCFTGTLKQAEIALNMGHSLSFTGVVTYPKASDVREIVKIVPDDRFMVETDSPYLAPVPYRGKSNEPGFVIHTAEKIAEIREISFEECAGLTTKNALRFFPNLD